MFIEIANQKKLVFDRNLESGIEVTSLTIISGQDSGKDKYSPQCECTVLADLSVDSIYIPHR